MSEMGHDSPKSSQGANPNPSLSADPPLDHKLAQSPPVAPTQHYPSKLASAVTAFAIQVMYGADHFTKQYLKNDLIIFKQP